MLTDALKLIGSSYREIISEYGEVTDEELIEMIKLDDLVPTEYKEGIKLQEFVNYIRSGSRYLAKERRMELYKQGYTIKQIAEMEGYQYQTILFWFKSRNIKVTTEDMDSISMKKEKSRMLNLEKRGGKSAKEVLESEYMQLYKQGLLDKDIVKILNVSATVISEYRKKLKLPPNKKSLLEQAK